MTQEHALDAEKFTCEAITDEIAAYYTERGYTLTFAEEVMRFDLSLAIPDAAFPPSISCLPWEPQTTHEFFTAYEASFRERPGFPHWSEEQWVDWISTDPTFRPDRSWVALTQDQVVGFIADADDEQAPGHIGYIIQVGTHPQWRHRGLATLLITRSLRAWKDEGKEAVILHVNVNNPGAIHLYQKLGFTIIERRGTFCKQRE